MLHVLFYLNLTAAWQDRYSRHLPSPAGKTQAGENLPQVAEWLTVKPGLVIRACRTLGPASHPPTQEGSSNPSQPSRLVSSHRKGLRRGTRATSHRADVYRMAVARFGESRGRLSCSGEASCRRHPGPIHSLPRDTRRHMTTRDRTGLCSGINTDTKAGPGNSVGEDKVIGPFTISLCNLAACS